MFFWGHGVVQSNIT